MCPFGITRAGFGSKASWPAEATRSRASAAPPLRWARPSLHFALQEKQQPFSASDHTTADPESSNSANGDPAALRQITFARLKLLSVVHRISDHSAHPRCWSRSGRFRTSPPFQTTLVGVHGCPTHI